MIESIVSKLGAYSTYTPATFAHIMKDMRVNGGFRPFLVQQINTLHIPNAQLYYCNRANNVFVGYDYLSQTKQVSIKNTLRMPNARVLAEAKSKEHLVNMPMPCFKHEVVLSGDIAVWWI